MTARRFAAEIGVNANSLANWKWKLESSKGATGHAPAFVEVTEAVLSKAAAAVPGLEVVCGGLTVRVPREFDGDALVRLLDVLEGR